MFHDCYWFYLSVGGRAHLQFDCFNCIYRDICPDKCKIQPKGGGYGKADCFDGKGIKD